MAVKKPISKRKTTKASAKRKGWLQTPKLRPLIVVLIFGLMGVGYFLYQTFAATTTASYSGVLTASNPTAEYKLTSGSGAMNIAFSNNTADLLLKVKDSANNVVGSVKSIGKKDAYLDVTVLLDTYTISVESTAVIKGKTKKTYSIRVTYPVEDITSPTAVIKSPLNNQTLSGTVDYTVDAQDDVGIDKVEFYASGVLLDTDTTAPYAIKWDTTLMQDGVYQLAVRSYDTSGNIGSASGEVTIKNAIPETASRFPGDPNTKVTGKAYWGASGSHIAEHEAATGTSVSLRRSFYQWGDETKIVNAVKSDHAANRLPWVSIKTPGWASLASGSYDAELDGLLRAIDATSKPVWFTVHHEPENDSTSTGEYSAENFRAMQTKVRQRMTEIGTSNIAFMPIFQGYSWASAAPWNINDFYVEGIWNAIGFDHYADSANVNPLRQRYYDAVTWIEAKGLPYAIGEWGNRDYDNPSQSAQEMRDFWEWGFTNKKDALGYSYYDSGLNSPDGTWELSGERLDVWRDILKNDTRVQRLNDL